MSTPTQHLLHPAQTIPLAPLFPNRQPILIFTCTPVSTACPPARPLIFSRLMTILQDALNVLNYKKPKYLARHCSNGQVDLWNKLRSYVNMLLERPHVISYLLAIAMFVLSVTVCKILAIEMCMTLTSRMTHGRKAI